jgi:hypothetical protein
MGAGLRRPALFFRSIVLDFPEDPQQGCGVPTPSWQSGSSGLGFGLAGFAAGGFGLSGGGL